MGENVFADKALQNYLADISKYPPLSREEEHRLALLAKEGDQAATTKLIQANLKFVVKIATQFQNRGLSLSELISEGNIGLIKAIEKFNPDMNIKLISYAIWWIKQRIMLAVSEKSSMIRVPLGKSNTANKIKATQERIFNETGESASMLQLEEQMNLDSKTIDNIRSQMVDTLSIDEMMYNQGSNDGNIHDLIEDPSQLDPQSLYYNERLQESINSSIDQLDNREKLIIREYFGLDSGKGKNFAQIADELGLSRERVRQIQKQALQKIWKKVSPKSEAYIDYVLSDI